MHLLLFWSEFSFSSERNITLLHLESTPSWDSVTGGVFFYGSSL